MPQPNELPRVMPPIALGDVSRAALLEAADANFAVHAAWAVDATDGMRVSEEFGVVLSDSGLNCDTFNVACRARFPEAEAPHRVRSALGFYRESGSPFSWWVSPADTPVGLPELLLAEGLREDETEVAMAVDLAGLRTSRLAPAGLEIRRVHEVERLRDFARHYDDVDVLRFYERAAPALLAPDSPQWFYVGYIDGVAVATSEVTFGGGVAGIYCVSTLEAFRRRGIGTAMTLQPLLDARGHG
ncbi:GNAT family N-acetyltransferase, partial [Candidatus Poribacteria bacterium]|nr:GNAT family N-acetyltransferase [Candidatus Poribacteria bacterium]